jgi:transposase
MSVFKSADRRSLVQTYSEMKTYVINTHPLMQFPSIVKELKKNAGKSLLFHIGLDAELHYVAVSVMIDGGNPRYQTKHSREAFCRFVEELISLGHQVHCVQEACGFGPYLHRDLIKLGAYSIIVAPKKLDDKRKTDKADANKLAQELWDFEHNGDKKRFKIVRDLTEPLRENRAISRQHQQLVKNRNILSGNGRGLMYEHGFYKVPEGWWGARKWVKLKAELEQYNPWLITMLEPIQQVIQTLHKRILLLTKQVEEERCEAPRPKGLGKFTSGVLGNEVGDWYRFNNRKQVSSFTGLCPSEHSSGKNQRFGSIDKQGNKRIRRQLVEAVWRLQTWNPDWRGFKKFPHVFGKGVKSGKAIRKKAVVACARMLMIDLWRLNTGQTTLEALGMVPADANES